MNWWLEMTRDMALLGAESAEVMARRTLVLARCDRTAWTEFQLMVSEKAEATFELQSRLLTGKPVQRNRTKRPLTGGAQPGMRVVHTT